MIYIKNIKKSLSKININVNFEIEESSIFGIIGKSGSGKSTLLKIIADIEKYDDGQIVFEKETKKSMVFQEFNLLENKTVYENILLSLKLGKEKCFNKVLEVLEFVDMLDKKDNYPSELSGGEKQRVAIARAIVTKPNLILCDEPTSSLDKKNTEKIIKLFLRINREYNTTIIIVSHELDIIKTLCDRVIILEDGKIIEKLKVNKDNQYIKKEKSYLDLAKEVLSNG